ncbi:MAG TPA: sigma-70 factor domain-containing protein, partial [Actinophytocola sp.]|nr:sigma-70 factor domain-containing protein [Actinophytocola sp.]
MAAARTATRRSTASASAAKSADAQPDAEPTEKPALKTAKKPAAKTTTRAPRKTAAGAKKTTRKTADKSKAAETNKKADGAESDGGEEPELDSPDLADLEDVEIDVVDDAVAEEEPAEEKPTKEGKDGDFVWDEEESEALRQARKDAELTASADSVRAYLKQIGKVALLNAEEEVELAKRIEAGLYAAERVRKAEEESSEKLLPQMRRDLRWIVRDGERAKNHLLEA